MGSCLSRDPAAVHRGKAAGGAHSNGGTAGSRTHTNSVQAKHGQRQPGKAQLPEIHTAPPVPEVNIWEAPAIAGKSAATLIQC